MSIKQFNGGYSAHEDRILFRFNTEDGAEYALWLSRRITLFILNASEQLIERNLEQAHAKPTARAIAQFQQETAREQTSFEGEFQSGKNYPLGQEPILAIESQCSIAPQADGSPFFSVQLTVLGNKHLNLQLILPTLQTMRLLLDRLAAEAGWVLAPVADPSLLAALVEDSESDAASPPKKSMH